MRDFCKISPQFWTGKTGKSLRGDPEAQIVALYLMTSPHSNMIGIYVLPMMYLAHETGLTIEGASEALARLCEAGFCTFEADSEVVWVHEMARYQIGDHLDPKDKRCKGVQNELAKVASDHIRRGFAAKYKDDFHLSIEGKKHKPLTSPFEAPCKQGEGEGEGEGEHPLPPAGGDDAGGTSVPAKAKPEYPPMFDEFWTAYPKKVGKDAAAKAFGKRKPNRELVQAMVQAIRGQKHSDAWKKQDGQFIPNPAKWLNDGRWKDGGDLLAGDTGNWAAKPAWVVEAGFEDVADANSSRCYEHNAAQFQNGKRLEAA